MYVVNMNILASAGMKLLRFMTCYVIALEQAPTASGPPNYVFNSKGGT